MRTTNQNDRCLPRRYVILALGFFLAGCSQKSEPPAPAPAPSPDKVVIKGSNTVGEELAPRLIAEFKKTHPKAEFSLESKGTGSGFSGLTAGTCDIAAASRVIIPGEKDLAQAHGVTLNEQLIGAYSIAVIVNAANPVSNLSSNQVRSLFTGTTKTWREVGGSDASVHLYVRNPISGTYLGFQELAMDNKPYATDTRQFTNYAGIVEAVVQDPTGIGYANLQLAGKPGVKAIVIEGVQPTAANVNSGKYPFARFLHLYTHPARETALAREFIEFVISAPGQQLLDQMGFVPHP